MSFYGVATVGKGWYELTAEATDSRRNTLNANFPGPTPPSYLPIITTARKVGIDEVFVIAGHSKAQGANPDLANNYNCTGIAPNTPDVDALGRGWRTIGAGVAGYGGIFQCGLR